MGYGDIVTQKEPGVLRVLTVGSIYLAHMKSWVHPSAQHTPDMMVHTHNTVPTLWRYDKVFELDMTAVKGYDF